MVVDWRCRLHLAILPLPYYSKPAEQSLENVSEHHSRIMEDNDGGALPKKGNVLMLHDKRFNSNVLRFEHSPTMDLLAVALSDKSIAVHRSVSAKFQRLLSISTGNDIPASSVNLGMRAYHQWRGSQTER